jgi:1-acyl-sn-glycerol-3-phosphate acyltransferase
MRPSPDPRSNAATRDALVAAILGFLSDGDFLVAADIRPALESEIDGAGPEALLKLKEQLGADTGWGYYPPDPLARRVHRLVADRLLPPDSALVGGEHLSRIPAGPLTIYSNHLSYADANLIEILFHRFGFAELAGRLTAIAGPKVFTSRQRRFSSLCFGTVKVPQSAEVSTEEAVLSAREVARAARRAIETAHDRLKAGDALVIFAEGRRSRTGAMHPLLGGAARYLEVPGTRVLPVGLVGTDALFPIGDQSITPSRVVVTVGPPLDADAIARDADGDRRIVMDGLGLAIAALLPPAYRGVYADTQQYPAATRALDAGRRRSAIPRRP